MVYKVPVPTRKEWQQLRDKNKVPKGAAKVSIGDSIDDVHKTYGLNTIGKHEQAVKKLDKDVDVYLVTVTKKHPTFAPIVTKELKKGLPAHLRFLADITKAKTEYYPRFNAVVKAITDLKLQGTGSTKDVANAMTRLLGCVAAFALIEPNPWESRRKALNVLMTSWENAKVPTPALYDAAEKALKDLKA